MKMLLHLFVVFAKHLNLTMLFVKFHKSNSNVGSWISDRASVFPRKIRKMWRQPHYIWSPVLGFFWRKNLWIRLMLGTQIATAMMIFCICKICQRLSICSGDFSGTWEHFCPFGKSEQPRHWFQSPPSSLILMEVVLWHNLHHNWMKFRENCVFLWLQLFL